MWDNLKKIVIEVLEMSDRIKSKKQQYFMSKYIERIHIKTRQQIDNGEKIRVAFIVQFPEMWNSTKSIYECMVKDDQFETYIITVPKRGKSNILYSEFLKENEAYKYFFDRKIKTYSVNKNNCNAIIKKIAPNYIFLQRPYDAYMPKKMSQYRLAKKSILCYVPYGYEFVNGIHLDIEYNKSALDNIYFIFCDNSETYKYVAEKSSKYLVEGKRKIFDIGYPKFDSVLEKCMNKSKKNTFLWLPRWSLDDKNDKSNFFEYFDLLVEFFHQHQEFNLIIRPHPLMFSNFVLTGVLSQEEVCDIKTKIGKMPNVHIDNSKDYLNAFTESDFLIADFTSLLIEYYVLRKPIIYCGSIKDFNSIGMLMKIGMYCVNNWNELMNTLEMLICGQDEKKKVYLDVAEKLSPKANVGEHIKNIILKDIF